MVVFSIILIVAVILREKGLLRRPKGREFTYVKN
jgi:hypothetical protein